MILGLTLNLATMASITRLISLNSHNTVLSYSVRTSVCNFSLDTPALQGPILVCVSACQKTVISEHTAAAAVVTCSSSELRRPSRLAATSTAPSSLTTHSSQSPYSLTGLNSILPSHSIPLNIFHNASVLSVCTPSTTNASFSSCQSEHSDPPMAAACSSAN